jgi:hypothetical protein
LRLDVDVVETEIANECISADTQELRASFTDRLRIGVVELAAT